MNQTPGEKQTTEENIETAADEPNSVILPRVENGYTHRWNLSRTSCNECQVVFQRSRRQEAINDRQYYSTIASRSG